MTHTTAIVVPETDLRALVIKLFDNLGLMQARLEALGATEERILRCKKDLAKRIKSIIDGKNPSHAISFIINTFYFADALRSVKIDLLGHWSQHEPLYVRFIREALQIMPSTEIDATKQSSIEKDLKVKLDFLYFDKHEFDHDGNVKLHGNMKQFCALMKEKWDALTKVTQDHVEKKADVKSKKHLEGRRLVLLSLIGITAIVSLSVLQHLFLNTFKEEPSSSLQEPENHHNDLIDQNLTKPVQATPVRTLSDYVDPEKGFYIDATSDEEKATQHPKALYQIFNDFERVPLMKQMLERYKTANAGSTKGRIWVGFNDIKRVTIIGVQQTVKIGGQETYLAITDIQKLINDINTRYQNATSDERKALIIQYAYKVTLEEVLHALEEVDKDILAPSYIQNNTDQGMVRRVLGGLSDEISAKLIKYTILLQLYKDQGSALSQAWRPSDKPSDFIYYEADYDLSDLPNIEQEDLVEYTLHGLDVFEILKRYIDNYDRRTDNSHHNRSEALDLAGLYDNFVNTPFDGNNSLLEDPRLLACYAEKIGYALAFYVHGYSYKSGPLDQLIPDKTYKPKYNLEEVTVELRRLVGNGDTVQQKFFQAILDSYNHADYACRTVHNELNSTATSAPTPRQALLIEAFRYAKGLNPKVNLNKRREPTFYTPLYIPEMEGLRPS